MRDDRDTKFTLVEWGVIASLFMSAAGGVFSVGVLYANQQSQGRDIEALKAHGETTTDRLARIETKLDLLIEANQSAHRGQPQ